MIPSSVCALDIDECASNATNPCNQMCTNNNGGFECSCMIGFQLQSDGFTCEGEYFFVHVVQLTTG